MATRASSRGRAAELAVVRALHVEARTSTGDVHNALANANAVSPVIEARTSTGDVTISTR